jgi:bifunctional non-homologous end joining protein LigD
MLATTGPLPTGPGWGYEFKWDGVRSIAQIAGGRTRFFARSGAEITAGYPELAGLGTAVDDATVHDATVHDATRGRAARHPAGRRGPAARDPARGTAGHDTGAGVGPGGNTVTGGAAGGDTVLDGEIIVVDAAGHPSFARLAERIHVRDAARAAAMAAVRPVTYMIFDLLRLSGTDMCSLRYEDRRAALDALGLAGDHWLTPPMFTDGPATRAAAGEHAIEGVMAKRLDSPYRPGRRSREWVKFKLDRTAEFVVGGWRPGGRALGALLVGVPGPDGLTYRGRVGGGISGAVESQLLASLKELASDRSPFAAGLTRAEARDTSWVRPELVIEVRYGQQTPDGRLRFPRLLRVRPDLAPGDVSPAEFRPLAPDDRAGDA